MTYTYCLALDNVTKVGVSLFCLRRLFERKPNDPGSVSETEEDALKIVRGYILVPEQEHE